MNRLTIAFLGFLYSLLGISFFFWWRVTERTEHIDEYTFFGDFFTGFPAIVFSTFCILLLLAVRGDLPFIDEVGLWHLRKKTIKWVGVVLLASGGAALVGSTFFSMLVAILLIMIALPLLLYFLAQKIGAEHEPWSIATLLCGPWYAFLVIFFFFLWFQIYVFFKGYLFLGWPYVNVWRSDALLPLGVAVMCALPLAAYSVEYAYNISYKRSVFLLFITTTIIGFAILVFSLYASPLLHFFLMLF